MVLDVPQQYCIALQLDLGVTEFPLLRALHLATKLLRHGLHAVADAQYGYSQLENQHGGAGGEFTGGYRLWTTRQNNTPRLEFTDGRFPHIKGIDFAVHADLADAPGDQLGVLGAKIENQDFLGVDVWGGHGCLLAAGDYGPGGIKNRDPGPDPLRRSSPTQMPFVALCCHAMGAS